MRRYRGSKKYGGEVPEKPVFKPEPILKKLEKVAGKEPVETYGCGCKKEEGVYLCKKHQRR